MSSTTVTAVNEIQLRNGIMPRAQLSKAASEIALKKTRNPDVRQFAEWELMEATTVVKVLKDLDTTAPAIGADAQGFLAKLEAMDEKTFNSEYMQAELSNHEFLRDLARDYIDGIDDGAPVREPETWHVANLALFAFTEHVGLCSKLLNAL